MADIRHPAAPISAAPVSAFGDALADSVIRGRPRVGLRFRLAATRMRRFREAGAAIHIFHPPKRRAADGFFASRENPMYGGGARDRAAGQRRREPASDDMELEARRAPSQG
jgi:hypothetical protein